MKNALLFLLLLVMWTQISAQSFQIAGVSYAKHFKSGVKDATTASQQLELQDRSVFLKLPIQLKNEKTVLLPSVRYTLTQPTLHNSPLFVERKKQKDLKVITFSAVVSHKMSAKWTLMAALTPTWASDFVDDYSDKDLLMQGALLAFCKLNDTWTVGGGAIRTTQLGDPRFLPALQLRYHKQRHTFNMLLPSFARYMYQLDAQNKWHIGARFGTNGGNFNVSTTEFDDNSQLWADRALIGRVNLGGLLQYQVHKNLLLEAHCGVSASRNFRLQLASGDLQTYEAANGGYIYFGAILTVPTKDTAANNLDN
jgi:Domain of unknown function (DUF6268)